MNNILLQVLIQPLIGPSW